MRNPHEREVENMQVRVRCQECRTHFHERVHRVVSGERVVCPSCHDDMRFHGIGHIEEHESVEAFIHRVEERTNHPHFSLSR